MLNDSTESGFLLCRLAFFFNKIFFSIQFCESKFFFYIGKKRKIEWTNEYPSYWRHEDQLKIRIESFYLSVSVSVFFLFFFGCTDIYCIDDDAKSNQAKYMLYMCANTQWRYIKYEFCRYIYVMCLSRHRSMSVSGFFLPILYLVQMQTDCVCVCVCLLECLLPK